MTKYAGKDFLLKISDGASPDTYTTLAGLRSNSLSINNEQIDVTDKDDSRWRKLIEGGVRSISLSGSGLLQNATAHSTLVGFAKNGTIFSAQCAFANMTMTGRFQISSFEVSGEYTDAQQYSVTLESADDIAIA